MLCSTVLTVIGLVITFSGRIEKQTNHLYSHQKKNDEINCKPINTKLCSPKKKVCPHAVIIEHLQDSEQSKKSRYKM